MSKGYIIVLGAIAGLAFGAADFLQQRTKAGGEFTPGDYIASVLERRAEAATDKAAAAVLADARKIAPRDYLSPAPEGWQRHDYSADLYARLAGPKAAPTEQEKEIIDKIKSSPLGGMITTSDQARDHSNAATAYLYTRGDEVVMISAKLKGPASKGRMGAMIGAASVQLASYSKKEGFAVIKGVNFFETVGMTQVRLEQPGPQDHRRFTGSLGNTVMIKVESRAHDDSLRQLLGDIDYDALNLMLEQPLLGVGSQAPALSDSQQQFVLDTTLAAMKRAEPGRRRAAERQMTQAMQPTAMERALVGAAGGAAQSLNVTAPSGKQARATPAPDTPAPNTGPIDSAALRIVYDSAESRHWEDAAAYRKGRISPGTPAHDVQEMMINRGLPPGSCLSVDTGRVLCNVNAERMRAAEAAREQATARTAAPVKVNRPGKRQTGSSCGGGNFCRVGD
ncbi:MAG: hypothetical protein CML02_08020 [Pseudooceanicola sp.]|nr:hypothetical protein [Pseudooceanicola sp.]